MTAWLQNAELARRAQKLGELVRYQTSLPPRLSEFAILVVARHWTAHFEWQAHKKEALKAGINPEAIAMIAARRRPFFENDAQRVVYDISNSLLETKSVADDLYQTGVGALGEKGVVELVAILGYYSLVAMTLNAFEIGLPDSLQPELLGRPAGDAK
jgi:4-carboxymuconolactone decarboxylase